MAEMRMRLRRLLGASGLALVVTLAGGVGVAQAVTQPQVQGAARDAVISSERTSGTFSVATENVGGTWYAYAPSYYSNVLTAVQMNAGPVPGVGLNNPTIVGTGTPSGTQLDGADAITIPSGSGIAFVVSKNENGPCASPVPPFTGCTNDAGTGNALSLFDVSTNPATPAFISSVSDASDGGTSPNYLFGADGVAVASITGGPNAGTYALVTARGCLSQQPCPDPTVGNDLDVINVSTLATPTEVGHVSDSPGPSFANDLDGPSAVAVSGNYAYVTSQYGQALTVVDISNPASPTVVAELSSSTAFPSPSDIAIQGNYAYVVNSGGTGPLTVINIANPTSPTYVSTTNTIALNGASRIRVAGDFAYVAASGLAAVTPINISNPAAPSVLTSVVSSADLNAASGLDLMNVSGSEYVVAASPFVSGETNYQYPTFPAPNNSAETNTGTISDIQLDPATNAPTIAPSSEPGTTTTATSADFTFSTTDAVATVACSLDGGAFVPCTTQTSQLYTGLAVGAHTFTVQSTDAAGNTATANYTWTVQAGTNPPPPAILPVSTARPVINGSSLVGGKLTATTGSWLGSPTSYSYQWQRCNAHGTACVGLKVTSATYTVGTIDIGDTLRVVVTASNSAGSVAATSALTGVVAKCGTVGKRPAYCRVPKLIARPQVTGTMKVGEPLVATPGAWSALAASAYGGAQLATIKSHWLRCNSHGTACTAIPGATRTLYKPTARDVGHTLRLQVVAKNRNGTASSMSVPSSRIVPAATKTTLAVKFSPGQPLVHRGIVEASVKSNVGAYLGVLFAVKIGHGGIQWVTGSAAQGQAGRFVALTVKLPRRLAQQMRAALAHHEHMKAAVQGVRFLFPGHNGSQQTKEYKFYPSR